MTVIREANEPPIATTTCQEPPALPNSLFARPAEQVVPELIGCLRVKRKADDELLLLA